MNDNTKSDENQNEEIINAEEADEENADELISSTPDPEEVNKKDTLESAQDMGLHPEDDEEHPGEVGVNLEEL